MQPHLCNKCAEKLPINTQPVTLVNRDEKQYFTKAAAAFIYEEPIKSLILELKYNANGLVAQAVAPFMAAAILKELSIPPALATRAKVKTKPILIPVPLCAKRQKERGYNQAELLANEIGRYLDLPVDTKILKRIKATTVQKNMNVRERADNLRDAFAVSDKIACKGKTFILIDDVFTTGATLNECAKALKNANARQIDAVACARVWHEQN